MIRSFRNRALQRFWERHDASRLPPDRIKRITMVLDRLDASVQPIDMDLPGLDFHKLSGDQKGRYAVKISGNWRITFGWDDTDAMQVDFEDYH